ncbi:hypothetical protein [Kingella potus]|uniref:hypothetical protein n=1 Tax=Kingella potus TaxID=265175 RepID=UPI001FD456A3|nr:hypothetical protein [Kingella potus]UOP00358.1 hypothetical protein LVJ84_10735 [Kingella potus]
MPLIANIIPNQSRQTEKRKERRRNRGRLKNRFKVFRRPHAAENACAAWGDTPYAGWARENR